MDKSGAGARARPIALALAFLLAPTAAAEQVIVHIDEASDPRFDDHDVVTRYDNLPFVVLRLDEEADLTALASRDGVLAIHPDDPLEAHLDLARMTHGAVLDAGVAETGRGVGVAIVDTSIDTLHPGFEGRIDNYIVTSSGTEAGALPVTTESHGTHIAGIIGGDGARSPQNRYRGLAPEVQLIGLDISEEFTTANALRAFDWILNNHETEGIRIVSNSWGRQGDVDGIYDPGAPLVLGSNALMENGMLVIFSSGNRGGASSMDSEALNPEVITVGAADVGGAAASYSSYGPPLQEDGTRYSWAKPDLLAFGDGVVSARGGLSSGALSSNDRSLAPLDYRMDQGTSMAAAVVSGVAALMFQAYPALTPEEAASILRSTSRDVGLPGVDDRSGWGFLDAALAVETARIGRLDPGLHQSTASITYEYSVAQALGLPLRILPSPGIRAGTGFAALVPVPEGTQRLAVEVAWTGTPGTDLSATLESPSGARQNILGAGSVRTAVVTDPDPGAWRVRVTPGFGVYEADVTITGTIQTTHPVTQGLTIRELVIEATPTPTEVPRPDEGLPALPMVAAMVALLGAAVTARRRQG